MPAYTSKCPSFQLALRWWLRNPLHNFCFYVIGTADRFNSRLILLRCSCRGICCLRREQPPFLPVVEPNPCFLMALHGGKPFICVRWPYSRCRKGEIYLGWRERGNFGLKFQLYGRRKCVQ